MNRVTFTLIILACLSTTLALPGGAQLQQAQDCKDAAKWHLEQAMRWTQRGDQDYHLKASAAADEMISKGYSCPDWRKDRMEPFSAEGQAANQ